MAANHRTARGVPVDMDRLRLANESTIAVGNMRVNARGDELGPGGKVIKTRAQVMQERSKLHNSPIADDFDIVEFQGQTSAPVVVPDLVVPRPASQVAQDDPIVESASTEYVKPRGSFADSVAKETEVKQELLDPSSVLGTANKPTGIQRI